MQLDIASKIIFERSADTTSDGCVVCTSSISCPSCNKGEECLMSTQTCSECPSYYCSKIVGSSSGNSSGSRTGAIVGGIFGALAVILIAGFIYWFFFKKKNIILNDKEFQSYSDEGKNTGVNNSSHINNRNARASARLSSYDSFTKPNLNKNGNRNSMATTISTTNASNILPIAYIPGVTVRPTKANTKSVYSFGTNADNDSIFSDMNTIENASIIGPDYNKNSNTMTAIKLKPKLVNVDKIEEEDEEEYDEEEEGFEHSAYTTNNTLSNIPIRLVKNGANGDKINDEGGSSLKQSLSASTLVSNTNMSPTPLKSIDNSNAIGTIDEVESDSDSDSDLGSIHKNEYIQREIILNSSNSNTNSNPQSSSKDINLDLDMFMNPGLSIPQNRDSNGSNVGSFILDVDLVQSSPIVPSHTQPPNGNTEITQQPPQKESTADRNTQLSDDSEFSKKSPFDDEYSYTTR